MPHVRMMRADEAGRVRDLWMHACAEAGTPLPEMAARQILRNLQQYPAHQQVRCFVVEEQENLVGFLTCSVTNHPVQPGLAGEIEELYVQPGPQRQTMQAELVGQAVAFLQKQGTMVIQTRIGIGAESPGEPEQRAFWQSLGWVNDVTVYSIYGDIPGDPALQQVWDACQAPPVKEVGAGSPSV